MQGSALTLVICCFLWITLYFLLCLWNPRRSYEWHIRSVTLIHAILISVLCTYCIFVEGPWPFTHAGGHSSSSQTFIITVCLSYFLLDLSWCLYFKTEGVVMLFHHSLSILGMSSCLILGWWGTEMLATILGAEITNPLLQCRWFLRETGRYNGLLGDIVDWAFMILFGVFRIGIGSYLLYCYYQQDTEYLGRLGGTLIYIVGWVFWINIIQYGIKKYKRRKLKKEMASQGGCKQAVNNSVELNGNIQKTDHSYTGNTAKRKVNGSVVNSNLEQNIATNGSI